MFHDPERLTSELLQCLTQDKKRLGLLLGAGCPYSMKDEEGKPMIPDIEGLTQVVRSEVCCEDCAEPWENVCEQLSQDTGKEPNIEHILSRVRGLRDLAGSGEVRGLKMNALDDLERGICESIKRSATKELKGKLTPYHNLGNWIGATARSEPIEIFTTNYDLLLEQALEELRIPFFDGFVGSRQPFFDPYAIESDRLPSRWARLWKIHGSINWRSGLVDGSFKVWRASASEGGDVVIHPSHLKYEQSRKMPYLALMDRLRRFLNAPSTALIAVGYSFRDQHLNDVIIQSLQGTPSTAVFALMYGVLSDYEIAVDIAKSRSNLTLIARDGAIVGTKAGTWREVSEKPESKLPDRTVEWTTKAGGRELWVASLELGNFLCFGALLQSISGMMGPIEAQA